MRKHSVRKWLHAVLDLLPVLILPVFAIYEINHDHNEPISVEVGQNEIIDYNQYLVADGTYTDDYYFDLTTENTANVNYQTGYTSIPIINSHKYYFRMTDIDIQNASGYFLFGINYEGSNRYKQVYSSGTYIFDYTGDYNISRVLNFTTDTTLRYLRCYLGLFDLTQMFGIGNEPTSQEFETYFTNDYYEYSTGKKTLLLTSTITYDDTDVGSQMIYSLYKPVVNYFNFNNVFNFGDIYDWFQLNMFNGNAPMVAFIVWNIIVYEFIMDILFLVYSVFMFLIDFAEGTLEKFTGWCTRG